MKDLHFSTPHSHSFIDFNGDCAADLFLTTVNPEGKTVFEFYLRSLSQSKFCLVNVTTVDPLDSTISVVSFGDVSNFSKLIERL